MHGADCKLEQIKRSTRIKFLRAIHGRESPEYSHTKIATASRISGERSLAKTGVKAIGCWLFSPQTALRGLFLTLSPEYFATWDFFSIIGIIESTPYVMFKQ